jgi:predicted membrane-bound dolichyl-phosphate-mannose-protein mannosyltransferase
VATDLIAGWWKSDRLFCVAVGFLTLVFALATVSGVIMLLQRRPRGRYLIVGGAVIALLTYGGVFIAGARVAWIVYTLPVLPIASVVLALHPETKRWLSE